MNRIVTSLALVVCLASSMANADQSKIRGDVGSKNVVQVAIDSKAHSTLVTAVQAADLVGVLSNPGPFTVFAPTNEAFSKLPAGTVESLLKPENKGKLQDILEYHVFVGVLKPSMLTDGRDLGQANSQHAKIGQKDGKATINGAKIVASIPAANGIVHVIDAVLLPPES